MPARIYARCRFGLNRVAHSSLPTVQHSKLFNREINQWSFNELGHISLRPAADDNRAVGRSKKLRGGAGMISPDGNQTVIQQIHLDNEYHSETGPEYLNGMKRKSQKR